MVENRFGVVELVKKYVAKHQPIHFKLVVSEDPQTTRQEENWWYVVVLPIPANVRSHEYAEQLSDIEEEIREKENLNVLLVPTLAH